MEFLETEKKVAKGSVQNGLNRVAKHLYASRQCLAPDAQHWICNTLTRAA